MAADRITFVGHSTVLIELDGVRLITDPALRRKMIGMIRRQVPDPGNEASDDIDAVLLSHLHHDHLDFPSLKRIGRDTPIFVPVGGARTLRRRRYPNTTELRAAETARFGPLSITATHAEHNARRYKIGPRVDSAGFVVAGSRNRVYSAGDTDLFAGMTALAGDLDVALLPIGGWGPTVGHGHLDANRAAEAAAMLKPRIAIPIHWGTFLRADLGRRAQELLDRPGREFVAQLARRAPDVKAVVLEPGESLDLSSS
jgi:L-ascorbate metabolism protein UlaG (beta-lactamase superfamily)